MLVLVAGIVGSGELERPAVPSGVEGRVDIQSPALSIWTVLLLLWRSPECGFGRSCTVLRRTELLWRLRVLLRVWSPLVWLRLVWCHLESGWILGTTPVGCRKGICPSWSSDGAGAASWVLALVPPDASRECPCGSACRWCRLGHFVIPEVPVPSVFGSLPDSPVAPWVKWSSGIALCLEWWLLLEVVILVPVSSARIPKLSPMLWRWMSWLCQCPWCIRWSPSWSICQCESADWAAVSPEQSWVLGLASWVCRILANCRVSLTGEPLPVWPIRLGFAQWTGCVVLVCWTVSKKWVDYPWDGSGEWNPLLGPNCICPYLWPLDAWTECKCTSSGVVLVLQGDICLQFLFWSTFSSWFSVAVGGFAHKW